MIPITSQRLRIQTYGYTVPEMTLPRLIADKAARNGDKPFLTFMADQRCFTYRDMDLQSTRIANALLRAGIGHGTHVAVVMENSPEHVLAYFALGKLGAVAVPVNTSARGRQLTYFLEHGDCAAIIADAEFAERLSHVLALSPRIGRLYLLDQPGFETSGLALPPGVTLESFTSLQAGSDDPLPTNPRFDDLAMLNYTSGTTGPSKGNMLVQAAVVQNGTTTAESHGYRFDDVVYVSLPLNHANAYLCALWGALMVDASVALSRRFSVSRYWDEVRRSRATITNLLGSTGNMLWAQPAGPDDADNQLRLCNMIPVPRFAHGFEARFGCRIVCSYGLTDYANCTVFTLADPPHKLGSSGRPRSGVEICIVDADDMDLPAGATGEILVRTNNPWSTSSGYYKDPIATLAAMRNGWWHTGDTGYVDADGFLFFAERKKDALRRRGENISAYEVESIVLDHPSVADAAVYGLKTDQGEDEVVVSLMLKPDHMLTPSELIAHCVANMAHYMVPRFVSIVDDLPRTTNGKILKAVLRTRAQEDPCALWDREAHGIVVKR